MNLRRAESRQREHESQARYTLESPTPLHGYLLFLFCEIAMPCTFKAVPPGLQNTGLLELTSCRSQRRNTVEPIPCPRVLFHVSQAAPVPPFRDTDTAVPNSSGNRLRISMTPDPNTTAAQATISARCLANFGSTSE